MSDSPAPAPPPETGTPTLPDSVIDAIENLEQCSGCFDRPPRTALVVALTSWVTSVRAAALSEGRRQRDAELEAALAEPKRCPLLTDDEEPLSEILSRSVKEINGYGAYPCWTSFESPEEAMRHTKKHELAGPPETSGMPHQHEVENDLRR